MDLDSLLKSIREENKGGAIVPAKFFGEDRYSKYLDEFLKDTTIGGEYLTNEEKKEGYKTRNNKIDFEAFVNKVLKTRDEIKKQGQQQDTLNSSSPSLPESKGSAIVKRDSVNIEKFKPTEQTQENFDDIQRGIDSILESLREENALAKDKSDADRLKEEERKRKAQETNLEKPFEKLGGVVGAVLKPVKSLWEKIWNFIWNVFLGRTVIKLFEWFGKEENKKSLEAIGVFLKNTWPAILAAFLVFGTGLGGFIKGIVGLTTKFIPKIVSMVAKLAKSAVKFAISNPLAALAIAGGVATVAGLAQQATSKSNDEERSKEGKTQLDDTQEFGGISGDPMGGLFSGGGVSGTGDKESKSAVIPAPLAPESKSSAAGAEGTTGDALGARLPVSKQNAPVSKQKLSPAAQNILAYQQNEIKRSEYKAKGLLKDDLIIKIGSTTKTYAAGTPNPFLPQSDNESSEVRGFSGGGQVPGSGPNKDTVPAMLAPGEFVMSRGAVQKYGSNTLASMNAAGGGTNLPERVNFITYAAGGGMIGSKKEMGEKKEKMPPGHDSLMKQRDEEEPNIVINSTWGLPEGIPGMGGGGGGTNVLTNQAKSKTFATWIGDGIQEFFGITPKRLRKDSQSILGVDSNSQQQNMERIMSLPPEMIEDFHVYMKRTESNQINIKNTPISSSQKKLKTLPPPPRRSRPSVTSIPSMGSNNSSGGGYELESSGIDNSTPPHTVPRGRDKAKTLGVLI